MGIKQVTKEKKTGQFEKSNFFYALIVFLFVLAPIVFFQRDKLHKIRRLFKKKAWLAGFSSIIIWSIYIFITDRGSKDKNAIKRRYATQHAITAFLIAMFAYVDLTIAPFWTIWIVIYYLGDFD
jgi:hypothetical protein